MDDLALLLSKTLANIVVVSFDDWTEEDPSTPIKVEEAVQTLNGEDKLWDAFWIPPFAIVAKTTRISAVAEKVQIDGGPHKFIWCECHIIESYLSAPGSVKLGLFASATDAGPYEEDWVRDVCYAVESNEVRYLCGVFWPQSRPETLFKRLRACEDGVFFQPFWTEDCDDKVGDDEMVAVAAHFGVVSDNVKYISVYPAYLVVRGPSTDVSRPHISEQPW